MHGAIASASEAGVIETLRQGLKVSPEFLKGAAFTLFLAVIAALGSIVVPLAVQQTIDTGILAEGGVDTHRVLVLIGLSVAVLIIAGLCSALVNARLFRSTEAGLATLRTKAFKHIHDLSVLSQGSERRDRKSTRLNSSHWE